MESDNTAALLPPSPLSGSRLPKARPEWLWKPGVAQNPGGAPKGTRISTWMARFGEMSQENWPTPEELKKMPGNASIAMARLRRAQIEDGGEASTKIILESTNDAGQLTPADSLPIIQSIAQAIQALKASGVVLNKPKEIATEELHHD